MFYLCLSTKKDLFNTHIFIQVDRKTSKQTRVLLLINDHLLINDQ